MQLLKYALATILVVVLLAFVIDPQLSSRIGGMLKLSLAAEPAPEFAQYDSFSAVPDPVGQGCDITFKAKWTDTDDKTRMLVCKQDRGLKSDAKFLRQCYGGSWCTTGFSEKVGSSGFDTTLCKTTIPSTYLGTMDYYIYVCDRLNNCTEVRKHGRFEIVRNGKPVLYSVNLSRSTVAAGEKLTFSGTWSDPNGRDSVKLVVCSSETPECSEQDRLCESGASRVSPVSCTYVAQSSASPGTKNYYAYVCDSACGACSAMTNSTKGSFGVNVKPKITSTAAEPSTTVAGNAIEFSASWSDADERGEAVKLWICKKNAFDSSTQTCGTERLAETWCKPSMEQEYSAELTVSCSTTIQPSETPGEKLYYAFVCDDEGLCSGTSGAHIGKFVVEAPGS